MIDKRVQILESCIIRVRKPIPYSSINVSLNSPIFDWPECRSIGNAQLQAQFSKKCAKDGDSTFPSFGIFWIPDEAVYIKLFLSTAAHVVKLAFAELDLRSVRLNASLPRMDWPRKEKRFSMNVFTA